MSVTMMILVNVIPMNVTPLLMYQDRQLLHDDDIW